MPLATIKIYNLLRNFGYETTKAILDRDYPDVENRLQLLEMVQEVKRVYHNDLAVGVPFRQALMMHIHARNRILAEDRIAKSDAPPKLWKMAKNLIKSTADITATGFKVVEESVYLQRLKACGECEFLWEGFEDRLRCKKCGCFMRVKAKYLSQHCQIGRW